MTKTPSLPVYFTIYTSTGPLSKTYTLVNKRIEKTPSAQMYKGSAERCSMPFKGFGEALSEATSEQAFGYGLHNKKYGNEVDIVCDKDKQPENNIFSRTKRFFKYRKLPGILMLDYDPSEYGPILTAEELIKILITIDPNIAKAARIIRGSLSAGVHLKGRKPRKDKGFHIYIPVNDASDIPRYGKLLFDRLWLAGYGYIGLGNIGNLLVRSPIDPAVFSGERLDFVGKPIIQDEGLEYTEPKAKYIPGTYLDTSKLEDLDDEEKIKLKDLIAKSKEAIKPASKKKRTEQNKSLLFKPGTSDKERNKAIKILEKSNYKKLPDCCVLQFKNGDVATVAEVLADPTAFDGMHLADPMKGRSSGEDKAMFWWNNGKPAIHSFAHGGVLYTFATTKRYFGGVEPYYPHPDYLSKDAACKQMKREVKQWMKNPEGNIAFKAPAGIGKTHIVLEQVALAAKNQFIEYYVPTHQLANEVRDTLLLFNPKLNISVIRGRTHVDSNAPLCTKPDLIKSIQGYNYNIYQDVCKECEDFEGCDYLAQFEDNAQVRIFSHAYLSLARSKLEKRVPDLAIIDESFFQVMIETKDEFTLRTVNSRIKNKRLANVIVDSLDNKKPLLATLRAEFGDDVLAVLTKASKQVFPELPEVTTNTDPSWIKPKLESGQSRYKLSHMLDCLKAEIKKFPRRKKSITVRLVIDRKQNKVVAFAHRHELSRLGDVPVLCIDADFLIDVGQVFLPNIKESRFSVKRNARVTQIYTTTNAISRSKPRESATEGDTESKAAINHVKNLQTIINNVCAEHGPALIVGNQELIGNNKKNIKSKLKFPLGSDHIHFGALRGSNRFKDFETAIIIGRHQLPIDTVETQAAALWWDSEKRLVLSGKPHVELRGYRHRDPKNKLGVKVMVCKDDRAQLVLELQRECESLQAIDRLRLIHNDENKNIFVLSSVPLDLEVDNLVTLKDLIDWKLKIEKALELAPNGILVLSSDYLQEKYPQFFSSKSKAKKSVDDAGLNETLDYLCNLRKPILFNGEKYSVSTFRLVGERGGDRKVLVPRAKFANPAALSRYLKTIFPGHNVEITDSTIRPGGWGGDIRPGFKGVVVD